MIGSSRSYAIGMAHFRLAGGYLTLAIMAGIYLLGFFGVLGMYYYLNIGAGTPLRFTAFGVTLMMLLETLNLVIFGTLRIGGAVRGDFASRMIESHRLMPVSSTRAVLGYMLGSTVHVAVFGGMTLLFAGGLAMAAGTPLVEVAFKQMLLLLFTALIWSCGAMLSLFHRTAFVVAVAALLVGSFTTVIAMGYEVMPALPLLTGPLIGSSIFYFGPLHPLYSQWVYPASITGQAAFFCLFFAGACRCYRGTYRTAFAGWQAISLVAAWAAMSAAGIGLFEAFPILHGLYGMNEDGGLAQKQVAGSVGAGMLLALIPVYTLVREQRGDRRGGPLTAAAVAVVAAIVTCCAIGAGPLFTPSTLVTFLTVLPFLLTAHALCWEFRASTGSSLGTLIALMAVAWWTLPLVMSGICYEFSALDSPLSRIVATLSPAGMLVDLWTSTEPVGAGWGLAWMWACCALTMLYAARRPAASAGAAPAS